MALDFVMLCLIYAGVVFAECRKSALYAECRYAECRYAEYCYAECHYAECRYAECRYAECRYTECTGAFQRVVSSLALKYWNGMKVTDTIR
jgi:hypothetical protein